MNIDISIIIPAKNAEENIFETLSAVLSQKTNYTLEVILIDGGSTDRTQEIVKDFPQVKLLQIKPAEFGHGRTRNLGAKMASGRYLAYLNGDAVPKNEYWLERLLENFKDNKQVAGVYSRHLPKEKCSFFEAQYIHDTMPAMKIIKRISDIPDGDIENGEEEFFCFSTVSCAINKSVWEKMPFSETLPTAEDWEWAKKVLEAGYHLVYEPSSMVFHSHDSTFREWYKRCYEGTRTINSILGNRKTKLEILVQILFFPPSLLSTIVHQTMYLRAKNSKWSKVLKEASRTFSFALAGLWGDILGNLSE